MESKITTERKIQEFIEDWREIVTPIDPLLRPKNTMVYKATNKLNGEFYIGVTCKKYLGDRKSHHEYNAKRGSKLKFHRALAKYGFDNFIWEILSTQKNYQSAMDEEKRLIAELNPQYNITKGGGGVFGYRFSEESRKKMSLRKLGKPNGRKGIPLPEDVKNKISEKLKNRKIDPEEKRKNVERMVSKRRRKVKCENDGLVFNSITSASEFYNVRIDRICAVCGRRKGFNSVKGLKFSYAESDND